MLIDGGRIKGRQKGNMERAKKTVKNMQKRGTFLRDVAEILELPLDTINAWKGETFTIV